MVILLGMMGAGKSTVGRKLAESLGVDFADTDVMLQNRLGRPVSQLFKLYGEDNFRGHETAILKSLEPREMVLATGGGIVTQEENWVELNRLGTSVFLDVDLDIIEKRLAASRRKRPLLENENWPDTLRALMDFRRPMYERADIVVKVQNEEFDEVVAYLLENVDAT